MALSKGLAGVIADQTRISSTHNAILSYAGYPINELKDAPFEEIVYLLWHGQLPSRDELAAFRFELVSQMALPYETVQLMARIAREPQHPMSILRNCLRSKLSFGILLQKRKLLCLIIPVILLANSLKSFAQN